MGGAYVLIVVVDFISVWIKANHSYKEQERTEWENWGRKKYGKIYSDSLPSFPTLKSDRN